MTENFKIPTKSQVERQMTDADIQKIFDLMTSDLKRWYSHGGTKELTEYQANSIKEFREQLSYEILEKFIRLWANDGTNNKSCVGFIVNESPHKAGTKILRYGALLKCHGWRRPEKNFERFFIFELDNVRLPWTGIQ